MNRSGALAAGVLLLTAALVLAGLAAGPQGWAWPADEPALIVGQIRLPRTLGAWLAGALLGLAGALAQGLFRNPLADPYLLGAGAGASLAVVGVLAAAGSALAPSTAQGLAELGVVAAAFVGATGGVGLTLLLAGGARQATRLLLAGVVVGVLLGSVADLVTTWSGEALRGRQAFLLGSTALLGWSGVGWLAGALLMVLPLAWRRARLLDALTLGEDTARSLGLTLARQRLALVLLMALATGAAVSQAGLVAFVGLVAPHLARALAPGRHGRGLLASAGLGGLLLLGADIAARRLVAPQELPVGVLTAVLGGLYLLALLHRGAR
ncbi:FecCD family ABC transporter permease [Aquabacterium sp. J223]|uniref:FecCD family ABC transporter permease n=1 Tax=Aquabacterium sp. J223 TaxID=2898431 RepID=UPI0021ADFDA1|nr:iron ABC transporter permease [Aquabacterium sp. J223]UUX95820.1 iron ABC transporter permease [Aquabacterium sp. J223]